MFITAVVERAGYAPTLMPKEMDGILGPCLHDTMPCSYCHSCLWGTGSGKPLLRLPSCHPVPGNIQNCLRRRWRGSRMTAGPRRMVSTGRTVGRALRRLRDYIYSSVVIMDTKFLSEVYKSEIYLVWVSRGGSQSKITENAY